MKIHEFRFVLSFSILIKIAGYKAGLFSKLKGRVKEVLEIGIGTGPNLKYYASGNDIHVFGIDPNRKMENYARKSAEAAGLPSSYFKFIQAVCVFHLLVHLLQVFCSNCECTTLYPCFFSNTSCQAGFILLGCCRACSDLLFTSFQCKIMDYMAKLLILCRSGRLYH